VSFVEMSGQWPVIQLVSNSGDTGLQYGWYRRFQIAVCGVVSNRLMNIAAI
jgi:hypothetical protein